MKTAGRKSIARRTATFAAAAVLCFATERASALVSTYDNTTAGTVTDNSCGVAPAGGIDRTFTVPSTQSFTVSTIALGLNVSHTVRGTLRVTIIAPGGTSSTVVATSADTDDNYDILLSSNSEGAIDDNDIDPTAEPIYNRLVSVAAGTMNFYTGNSVGTWTVRVCDNTAGTTGTFNSARLILTSTTAVTARCTSTTTFDFGDWAAPFGTGDCDVQFTTNTTGSITTTLGSGANAPTQYGTPGIAIGSTGATPNFVTRSNVAPCTNNPQGNHNGYYALSMDGATGVDEDYGERVTFDFSPPVSDMSTSLLDLDWQGAAGWEDQAILEAFDASGAMVPYTMTPHSANQVAGNLGEGDASAAVTSDTSRMDYVFSRGVSRVRVTYSQGDEGDTGGGGDPGPVFQIIGIADFTMCAYDFGDAPTAAPDGTYGTAGHALGTGTIYLGTNPPDGEGSSPGTPGNTATVDDANAPGGATPDDEDGIASFPSIPGTRAGTTYTVSGIPVVNSSGSAVTLCGWIDFDLNGQAGDGTFESNEGSCVTTSSCTGSAPNFTCSLSWTVPADFQVNNSNPTYARFRVSSAALTTSSFSDSGSPSTSPGEVEDYLIPAGTLPVTVAFAAPSEAGIEWMTSSETANVGFRVLARAKDSRDLVELGRVASQALDSAEPRSYSLPFVNRLAPGSVVFLDEIGTTGKTRRHGPFAVGKPWGERPVQHDVDWQAVRAELAEAPRREFAAPGPMTAEARILISKAGIQRLTHADLLAAGVDLTGVPVAKIALLDAGKPVARFVGGSEFAKGTYWTSESFLEFYFEPKLTLASPYDALELRVHPGGVWVAANGSVPTAGEAVLVQSNAGFAPNRQYNSAAPNGDPWFDDRVLAFGSAATLTRSFDLPNLAAGSVSLTLDLWGVTNWPGVSPDHHVVVRLNGTQLESSFFDGLTPWTRTFDVSGRVNASGNQIEIVLPLDTGYSFDLVHLEGFSVSYAKTSTAENGRLEGQTRSKAGWTVNGFTSGKVSLWTGSTRTQLLVGATGSVVAPAVTGRFAMAETTAQWTPRVVAGIPVASRRPAADYLIVTHPDLAQAVDSLVALQQSRGLSVEVATTDAIYAQYSDHAPSAEAIRSYIAAAGERRLRYVLLVGAESYDPYDYLGLGSISYVPTSYTRFNEYVAFGPSDDVTADRDGDRVPDVAIGRLPVRTPSELASVVDKLVAWQGRAPAKLALIAAGKSPGGETSVTQVGTSHVAALGSWTKTTSFVDESSTAVVRADVLAALNSGTPLVSYVGHSSYGQWDSTPILKWDDVATLANVGQPNLVVQWGCWNAYFASPEVETLSNRLLLTPTVGAAAVIGSTALTSTQSHEALGANFLARVSAGDATIGQALLTAKRQLAVTSPGALDAIMGQVLLGDPATPLPR
jgi:subtilisin-like proprotein convertase family protein